MKLIRLNVNLNEPTAKALKELTPKGGTLTETVRRAVAILKFIEDEQSAGRRVLTMDANGKNQRELVLFR